MESGRKYMNWTSVPINEYIMLKSNEALYVQKFFLVVIYNKLYPKTVDARPS